MAQRFWLGHDALLAMYASDQYRGAWSGLQLRGHTRWTTDAIETVRSAITFYDQARAVFEAQRRREEHVAEEARTLDALFGPPPSESKDHARNIQSDLTAPVTPHAAIKAFLANFDGKRKSARHK